MAKARVEGVLIKYASYKGIFKSNPLIYFFFYRKANIILTFFKIFWNVLKTFRIPWSKQPAYNF
jgi:hypothetical protein